MDSDLEKKDNTKNAGETSQKEDDTKNAGETSQKEDDTKNAGETSQKEDNTKNSGETSKKEDDTKNAGETSKKEVPPNKSKISINIDPTRAKRYADDTKYFDCSTCFFKEKYDYFGRDPPFIENFQFKEDVYILKAPFDHPDEEEFVILGAHCTKCLRSVCRDYDCSFYYEKTYCFDCLEQCYKMFPLIIGERVKEMLKKRSLSTMQY